MSVAREAADGIDGQSPARKNHQHLQCPCGKSPQEERVEDVADVFEEERPAGAVQWEHLVVSPHIDCRSRQCRNQEHVQQQGQHHQRKRHRGAVPHLPARNEEGECPQQGAHHHHRLQANQSPPEEIPDGHLSPALVVGIPHHESREDKKEIHRQVAVVELLVVGACGECLEDMVPDHHDGRHAPQSVQDAIVRL